MIFYRLVLVMALSLLFMQPVHAQQPLAGDSVIDALSQCGPGDTPSYGALVPLEAQAYDVYVRLGSTNRSGAATITFEDFQNTGCETIASLNATSEKWTKAGSLAIPSETLGTFTLYSSALTGLPDANRPELLLVPSKNPICIPVNECIITVDGLEGELLPRSTLNTQDDLRILTASQPNADNLIKVEYFVDGIFKYQSDQLKPFDEKYIGGGQHELARVASYSTGERVVFKEQISKNFHNHVFYLLFNFYLQNKLLILIIGAASIVYLLFVAALMVAKHYYKRNHWQATHTITQNDTSSTETNDPEPFGLAATQPKPFYIDNEQLYEKQADKKYVIKIKKTLLVTGAFCIILIIINSAFIQTFSVDGPSMNTTFKDGQTLVINKTASTFSKVIKSTQLPNRGDVVVFEKTTQSNLFETDNQQESTYVVKRVIGLPGDRVVITDGAITVYQNNNEQPTYPDEGRPWSENIQSENMTTIDMILGFGELFVAGDNRPESIDSRYYGPISADDIIGTVLFTL